MVTLEGLLDLLPVLKGRDELLDLRPSLGLAKPGSLLLLRSPRLGDIDPLDDWEPLLFRLLREPLEEREEALDRVRLVLSVESAVDPLCWISVSISITSSLGIGVAIPEFDLLGESMYEIA